MDSSSSQLQDQASRNLFQIYQQVEQSGDSARQLKNQIEAYICCSSSHPLQEVNHLVNIFSPLARRFSNYDTNKLLCAKKLGKAQEDDGSSKDSLEMYYCPKCAHQSNSVFCIECFDKSKHVGHNYELLPVKRGICDCGDPAKWSEDTFCDGHEKKQRKLDRKLSKQDEQFLTDFCRKCFNNLCYLYQALEISIAPIKQGKTDLKEQNINKSINQIVRKVDRFGQQFLKQLLSINRDRYNLICATRAWLLRTQLHFPQALIYVKSKLVHEQMMRFLKLPRTAEHCVELLMVLFFQGEALKRDVTVSYFQLYSQIPLYNRSHYRMLSAQLFTNSKVIDGLIEKQQLRAVTLDILLSESTDEKVLKDEISQLQQSYTKYYKDLEYTLSFKNESISVRYWRFFQQSVGLINILNYRKVLAEHSDPDLCYKVFNKSFYRLQTTAMATCAKILSKVIRLSSLIQEILQSLNDLIFKKKQSLSNEPFPSYLLFTEHRALSMCLFVYLYKHESVYNVSNIRQTQIEQYLKLMSISQQQKDKYFVEIIQQTLRHFMRISRAVSSDASLKRNNSFAQTYFATKKNPNFLFSLDAFLLKFAVHCLFEIKGQGEAKKAVGELINVELQALQRELDKQCERYVEGGSSEEKRKKVFDKIQACIFALHSFVNLMSQSMFSDLVELVLLSYFQELLHPQKFSHQEKFISYYKKLLFSFKPQEKGVSLKQFKELLEQLFFKETKVLPQFIQKYQSKLNLQYLQQRPQDLSQDRDSFKVNINKYYSFRFKPQKQISKLHTLPFYHDNLRDKKELSQQGSQQRSKQESFQKLPQSFSEQQNPLTSIFEETNYLRMVKKMLRNCSLIKESQNQTINNLTKELLRVYVYTKSPQIEKYFMREFVELKVKHTLLDPNIMPQLYSFLDQDVLYPALAIWIKQQPKQQRLFQSYFSHYQIIYERMERKYQCNLESQLNTLTIYPQIVYTCSYKQQCTLSHPTQNLSFLCFVSLTNMHSTLQIQPHERIATFSATCGHLFHKTCLIKRSETNLMPSKCPVCHHPFNMTLTCSTTSPIDRQTTIKEIENEFESISVFIPHRSRPISTEIYRAISLFLLQLLIVDDLFLLRQNLMIYRSLYQRLKASKPHFRQWQHQIKILTNACSNSEFAEILRDIQTLLLNRLYGRELKVTKDHMLYLNHILKFLESSSSKLTTNPSVSSNQMNTTPLYRSAKQTLTPCLSSLSFGRKCAGCSSETQDIYYACLMAMCQEEKRGFSLCYKCILNQQAVATHIKKFHLNEILMVQTSGGRPFYLYLSEKASSIKLNQCERGSLYTKLGSVYKRGQGLKREQFMLSEQKVRQMLNEFFCWKLLTLALSQ